MPYELPESLQNIADIIGRDRALFLIGQLPRTKQIKRDGRTRWRIYVYFPLCLTTNCKLVQILGWDDALKLNNVFRGETLCLPSCHEMAIKFLHESIRNRYLIGVSIEILCITFAMTRRSITKILNGLLV